MTAGPLPSIDDKIAAFDLATGQDACERLLSIDGLPPGVDAETRRRMAALAPMFDAVAPSARSWPVPFALPGGWQPHGASIARSSAEFRMLVHAGNFTRRRDQSRDIHDAKGIARARNYWVELDADLQSAAVHAIQEQGLQPADIAIPSSGLLHGRPFFHHGRWWIVGVIGDAEAGQIPLPLLTWLDGVWLRDTLTLARNVGRDPHWTPILPAPGDPPRFLASVFPTAIWRMSTEPAAVALEDQHPAPLIARRLIVAAQIIPAAGGYLGLAHERVVSDDDDGPRTVHRWLWFDAGLHLVKLSRPVVLCQQGAERATGLARHDGELIYSVTRDDGQIWLGRVAEAEVAPLLAPPLALDVDRIERQLADESGSAPMPPAGSAPRRRSSLPRGVIPTIAAMTMTGSNREIVGDAVRSVVDWVDWCVLIDTGITDDTIEIVRAIAGDKLIVRQFPWCNDFSAARNFALAAAAETGASWAVFVDSDERMALNGVDIHQVLATTSEPSLLVPLATGEYTKDRFFRLPVTGEFLGATHEAFYITPEIGGATVAIPGVVFHELIKSTERMRSKDERDRDILRRYTAKNPHQPRWFFYLGDVLMRLGQFEEAIAAFRACHALHGWDEESAWAMYRATQCLFELNRLEDALEAIVLGMARHAGMADFPWFAGLISLRLGRAQQAVYWARHAIALGCFAGIGKTVHRVGWRYPYALWEGPYDVLRDALKALGDHAGAAEADRLYAAAAAARQAQPG